MDVRIEISCSNYPNTPIENVNMDYIDRLRLQAFIGDIEVSRMDLARNNHNRPWYVGNIQTHPGYVRQGLATSLYRKASEMVGKIEHSLSRSVYGDAWARSMGHEVPETPVEQLGIDNFELWNKIFVPNATEQTATTISTYFGEKGHYRCSPEALPALV